MALLEIFNATLWTAERAGMIVIMCVSVCVCLCAMCRPMCVHVFVCL